MQDLMGLLNIFDVGSGSGSGLFGLPGDLPGGSVAILIFLALIGASYINGMTKRTRYLDLVVSVSGMLIGGFVANSLARHVQLPFDSDVVRTAIIGLCGMTVTGLMLLYAYRRSED